MIQKWKNMTCQFQSTNNILNINIYTENGFSKSFSKFVLSLRLRSMWAFYVWLRFSKPNWKSYLSIPANYRFKFNQRTEQYFKIRIFEVILHISNVIIFVLLMEIILGLLISRMKLNKMLIFNKCNSFSVMITFKVWSILINLTFDDKIYLKGELSGAYIKMNSPELN